MKFSILHLATSVVFFLVACQQNTLNTSKPIDEQAMEQSFPKPKKEIADTSRQTSGTGLEDLTHSKKTTPKAAPTSQATPPASKTLLPWATHIDLVCDMTVEETTPDTVHYHGKVYGFCSAYCKEKFQENPPRWGAK